MTIEWEYATVLDKVFEHGLGYGRALVLPGSGEVFHIHGSYVNHANRGQGLGDIYHKERLDHIKEEGSAKLLTCIVNKNNEAEVKILKKNGWKFIHYFDNCILCVYDIPKPMTYDASQQPDEEEDL